MGTAAVILLVLVGAGVIWWLWERSHRKTYAVPGGLRTDIHLPHEQEFELYHNALSLCSKKTRLCLAELGIPYKGHHIDLIETGSYENIGRRYLAVHPGGILPLLVHEGHPIFESHEQIRYAAAHAPPGSPALVPDDPALVTEMERWVDLASLVGDDPLAAAGASAGNAVPGITVPLFAAMIEDIPVHRILEGLLFHRLRMRPLMFLAMKRTGIAKLDSGPARKVIRSCIGHLHTHMDAFESQLEKTGGPWILGESFSLADVSWVVILERMREADSLHVFVNEARPRTSAWWERMRARPSYRAAITEHAHPGVERGLERLRAAKAEDPALRAMLEGDES